MQAHVILVMAGLMGGTRSMAAGVAQDIIIATQAVGIMEGIAEVGIMEIAVGILVEETLVGGITKRTKEQICPSCSGCLSLSVVKLSFHRQVPAFS